MEQIEEQLVTFETAKMLRKIGFDIDCQHYYHSNRGQSPDLRGSSYTTPYTRGTNVSLISNKRNWNDTSISHGEGDDSFCCSAPTQALAQKWFRDKHKTDITILHTAANTYNFDLFIPLLCNIVCKGDFKTYEEALEKGLQEACKIIKDGS